MAYTLTYTSIDALTTKVTGFTGTPVDVVVPATADGGRAVVEIGAGAFASCSTITSIEMSSIVTIGNYAFQSCDSLSSISMTESVTSIGEEGFAYCTALASITIPDTVTSIGDYCFTDCLSLSTVTLPASITSLGTSLFFGCPSLLSITIPASVVSIGVSCFENCDYLASITFLGNAPTFGAVCFDDGAGLDSPIPATAYIPATATGWPTPPAGVGDPLIPTAYIEGSQLSATVEPAGSDSFCLSMWGIILGVPRPSYLVGATPTPFSDSMYSRVLWARMLNLRMNGSMKDINAYMNILFSSKAVSIIDNFNMTMTYRFAYMPDDAEKALIAIDGILPRPSGVEAIIEYPTGDESTVLGFAGQFLGQFDRSTFQPES